MKRNFVLLLAGIIGLAIVLYIVSPLSDSKGSSESEGGVAAVEAPTEPPTEPSAGAEKVPAAAETPAPPPQPAGPPPEVLRAFSQNLRALGTCLETPNTVPGDELEPNLQAVVDSVRGEWGESVIATEDWMQVEMQTPEGERRRLRVEMDFDSESQVQRKLKFMAVDPQGATSPIPVPEEQAVEPSESLIASLESGNKILGREKFERIYFQNGEEIVARQADGLIVDLEVNRGPKTFKCSKMNELSSQCQCIQ